MKVLSCFGGRQKDALEEGLIAGEKPSCVFCGVTREKGFDIVDEVGRDQGPPTPRDAPFCKVPCA